MSSVFVLLIIIAIIVYCLMEWIKMRNCNIPGPPAYPIIGNALLFLGKPNDVFKRLYKISREYRRLMSLWFGRKHVVMLFDAKDVEIILKRKECMEKAEEYKFLKPWLGDSILLSTGTKFRMHKKIILPSFHVTGFKKYVEIFNIHSVKLIESMKKEIGKEEFDIQTYLSLTMLSQLLETSLGVNSQTLSSENIIQYGKSVAELCQISHIRCYKIWLRYDWLFQFSKLKNKQNTALKLVHRLTDKVINKRKAELQKQNRENEEENLELKFRKYVLLDMLLKTVTPDGRYLSDQEIKDEVLTMMFAGQDTTSVTIGFLLSLLGLHKDIQDNVYNELEEIFGNSNRPATYEDLQKMVYLERVIQETLRLYPPIPVIARRITDNIQLDSCVIPKGCTVAIITMIVQRNSIYFSNPHQFNPDNFLPERIKERYPFAYFPFSGGLRKCIGLRYAMLNIKVIVSTILRNYKISANRTEKEFKLVALTTLKRREGFLINIEPRLIAQESIKT